MTYRTEDRNYGRDYFETLDGGSGYNDSTMWEDIAHIVKELFGFHEGVDVSSHVNVLDIGCAKGYLVRHLRRRGFDAWGIDISDYALENGSPDIKTYLRKHDLTRPELTQFGSDAYRLIICLETLEHIPEESVEQAIWHIHNLLVPGGVALLTICVEGQPDTHSDPTHVTIKTRRWWLDRLEPYFESLTAAEQRLQTFWLFSQHKGVFVLKK